MQSASETNMALWGVMMGNATMTLHAAGWLEGGLSFGYEKFINDVEALQVMAELCIKPDGSTAEIGFDAIKAVAPGGHFFATQHTMDRYRTAFYEPLVADLQNYGAWEDAGEKTSAARATGIWKQTLRDFVTPPTGEVVPDRLAEYMEKRIAAGGAAPME